MDVTIERREHGSGVELVVTGRLDAECAGELEHAVAEELRRGHHAIEIDLKRASFLSSAGIRVLFEIHRAAKAAGGSCLISSASEPVRKVLDLTHLTPILMGHHAATNGGSSAAAAAAAGAAPAAARGKTPAPLVRAGAIQFIGLQAPGSGVLQGRIMGATAAGEPPGRQAVRASLPRHAFALGLAALADESPLAARAGEMVAAGGAVFYRPPQSFAVVDYLIGTGDLVPEVDFSAGIVWHGLPQGRAGFEPADDEPAVPLDELVARLLEQSAADVIALVCAAEVQGLVGVELIRPLAEAAGEDRLGSTSCDIARHWLSFSREPVHSRRTALIVGVASRDKPEGALAAFVRPLGTGAVHGHFHAAVFPHRPLRRGAVDLSATITDLSGSIPLAVMHLLPDLQPVLGSGQSELTRGACWFAPLTVARETAS
jgi:anti-anti-sigma factor